MRINDRNIEEMLRKYMEGMTSVDEETLLAEYFSKTKRKPAGVAIDDADWLTYKEMFAMFERKPSRLRLWIRRCAVAAAVIIAIAGGAAWFMTSRPDGAVGNGNRYIAMTAVGDSIADETVSADTVKAEVNPMMLPVESPAVKKVRKSRKLRAVPSVPRHYLAEATVTDSVNAAVDIDEAVRQADLLMQAVFIQQQSELNELMEKYTIAANMDDGPESEEEMY